LLDGVEILVIAGCESSEIGDLLGVVPYVVTMSNRVEHKDAAAFTRRWWSAIGRGLEPDEAWSEAIERSPSGMSEYVVRHW
jgi:hypothetical protein